MLLTDFGIARESGKAGMTTINKFMGTPGYLSPEQASSAASVTHLSDIYSLGVVLFEILSGGLPWNHLPGIPGPSGGLFGPPLPLRSRGVQLPTEVDRIIETMLALEPSQALPERPGGDRRARSRAAAPYQPNADHYTRCPSPGAGRNTGSAPRRPNAAARATPGREGARP